MKWIALKEKSGAYEIRQNDQVFGGIIISGKNRGVGFIGEAKENRYVFEFEDGVFSKTVKVYSNTKENQIGTVKLGFTDSGTLEFKGLTYEWRALNSSKIWVDSEKNTVMFIDLENNVEKPISVLSSASIDAKTKELLMLCGWYLLVVEYRASLTNSMLAGMPVKTKDFSQAHSASSNETQGDDWFDFILDVIDVATD